MVKRPYAYGGRNARNFAREQINPCSGNHSEIGTNESDVATTTLDAKFAPTVESAALDGLNAATRHLG